LNVRAVWDRAAVEQCQEYRKGENMLLTRGMLMLCCLALLVLWCSVYGQETWGSVRIVVTDPSGAAVPGAKVEVSGGSLPRPLEATTGSDGFASVPQVPPGTSYVVAVTAWGFRSTKTGDVAVEIGKSTVLEVKLEVGQMNESVVVNAEATLVDTQSSSSAVTIDKSFFDIIPKGRSFYDLIQIAPGARNEGKSAGYQIDGASGAENTYYLDGMEMEDIQGGTLSDRNKIPVEMVQQLQVKNGIMEAQYGGAMGGVVSAVVRSGQNEFHGQAGFYWTGDSLTARPRPQLRLNPSDDNIAEYFLQPQDSFANWNPVFNIGGPIIRNKLFFFAGYAPQLNSTTRTVNFTTGETATYYNSYTQQYLTTKVDYAALSRAE
jgi:hypothetical protein